MGKHSSPSTKSTGSLFAAFKSPKKSGRHSPERSTNTAGGVLAAVRTRPVLSAFIVPTAATAAVVASSLAMVPSTGGGGQQVIAESPVVIQSDVTQGPDEFLDKAKKQAKEKPGKMSLELKTEAPSPTAPSTDSAKNDSGKNDAGKKDSGKNDSGKKDSSGKKSSTGGSGSKGGSADENDGPSKSGKSAGQSGSCPMSYYGGGGDGFNGRKTANGETFDSSKLTAAHKSLPFGTKVKITNTANGKSVTVRINDRGPHHGSRCIDLSKGAMEAVGGIGAGQINGKYEVQ